MGVGSWAGVSDLALLGGMVPQEVPVPFPPPALDGLNSGAFLRKCLSWQQLQPPRASLRLPGSLRAVREEKGEERELSGGGAWRPARPLLAC